MSIDEVNQTLEEKNWTKASILIISYLPLAKKEDKTTLAFNLIVCLINLKNQGDATYFFNKYKDLFDIDEIKSLEKEIKKINKPQIKSNIQKTIKESKSSISKDGQILKLGWFNSTTMLSDVIGLSKVKKDLKKKILNPIRRPDMYKSYGAKISSNALLFGPPGTGKTYIASALAGESGGKILIFSIPEILNKYQGSSEKNIKIIFDQARKNPPSIIFMDEIDGIAQDRSNSNEAMAATMKSLIDTLLPELDGIGKNNEGIFVIGATNMPWAIDNAFKRSGRFSTKIYVAPPNLVDRINLYKYYTKKLYTKKLDYLKLALASFGFTGSDINNVCESGAKTKANNAIENNTEAIKDPIKTSDLLKEIKELGKPTTFEWYANTLEEFKKLNIEERSQYKKLKKDILWWNKSANGMYKLQKTLSNIL